MYIERLVKTENVLLHGGNIKRKKHPKYFFSKIRKENHVVIVIDSKNEESLQRIAEELKKTIRKEDRLIENGVSFEINCNIKKL